MHVYSNYIRVHFSHSGSSKSTAKALLKDVGLDKKADIIDMQREVLVATLETQKAIGTTQLLLQTEAKLRIEKLRLELELLREKEMLRKMSDYIEM